jgi:hypothetical protein
MLIIEIAYESCIYLTWNDLSGRMTRYFGERSELVMIV